MAIMDLGTKQCRASGSNSWVMVTGGTGGIGKALIARLAARGQNVVATAREPDRISTALGPGRVVGVQLDMEHPETTSVAAREVTRIVGGGGLSGLVNMAGVIVEGPLETIRQQSCGANSRSTWSAPLPSLRRCCRC